MILLGVGNRDRYQISTLAADLAHHAAGSYAMFMAAWFMEQRCLEHRKYLFFAAFPKRTAYSVSLNRQGFILPSAVRRKRLQLAQKWFEIADITPTVP